MIDPDQQRRSTGGSESGFSGAAVSSYFLKARTALTVFQALDRLLAIQKRKGTLVDRARTEALGFRLARHERDPCVAFITNNDSMLAINESTIYLDVMNSKHRKTLAAVFTDPVSGTIEWAAVESLLLAAGARLIEGSGSRVRFEKDGEVGTFHRPHPAKEAKRYQVRDARDFLERIGVRP